MARRRRAPASMDGRLEQAKDVALGAHHERPSTADEIAEAAGGVSGALLGAGIAAAAGPIGILLSGIAGAMGGWWTGRAVSEAAERLSLDDEEYYRKHFESDERRPADRRFEDVRSAYYLGQIASHNPNFVARQFDDIERELGEGWASAATDRAPWQAVSRYAREGYARGVGRRRTDPGVPGETTRPDDSRS